MERSGSQRRAPLRQGTRLGDRLIVRGVLGEGGTAIVYEAFHTHLRSSVAVKMLSVGGPAAGEARARLIREAQICASIRDPRVPRVFEVHELTDGTPYMVMEKVTGPTLARVLRQGALPIRRACEIVAELLDTLRVIHERGVLHRDIKPGNVILEPRPDSQLRVRLMDFGVGKVLSPAPDDTFITRQGEVMGTPCYMAPEQIMGHPLDERVDLYAAGVVLYEMLAGKAPYEGHSVGELVAAVLRDDIKPLRTVRPEVPPALCLVIAKATAKHPALRYGSARAMRDALLSALRTNKVDAPSPKPLCSASAGESGERLALRLSREDAVSERPTAPSSKPRRVRMALGLTVLGLLTSPGTLPDGTDAHAHAHSLSASLGFGGPPVESQTLSLFGTRVRLELPGEQGREARN